MSEETKKKPGGNDNSGKKPYQRLKPYIGWKVTQKVINCFKVDIKLIE
jgi:hypothetical protein